MNTKEKISFLNEKLFAVAHDNSKKDDLVDFYNKNCKDNLAFFDSCKSKNRANLSSEFQKEYNVQFKKYEVKRRQGQYWQTVIRPILLEIDKDEWENVSY
jgi:hypothetical protein